MFLSSSRWPKDPDFDNYFSMSPFSYDLTFPKKWSSVNIDIIDNGKEFVIKAELPGRDKDDMKVKVDNRLVTITAENNIKTKSKDETYLRTEIKRGYVSSSVSLPENVDEVNIRALYKNGILEVFLPKLEKSSVEISID